MVQYDVSTPAEYFEMLEDDWRKDKVLQIREMILKAAPEIDEVILYKMLSYGNEKTENYVFGLNAQKNYVSLYVGNIERIYSSNT